MLDTDRTGLVGYIDVLLVNRDTGKIEKHIRQKNQITEPFARWLLLGNLCTHNVSRGTVSPGSLPTQIQTIDVNSISNMLGSRSSVYYQSITTDCGSNSFGIYLLNKEVNITPFTQIPPYLNPSLGGMDGTGVVYYGSPDTPTNEQTMVVDNATSKWSTLGTNPAFTTTYIKDDTNTAVIRSIVLGVKHDAFSTNGFNPRIVVFQSPPLIPSSWDNSWGSGTSANVMNVPVVIKHYLVNKFARTTKKDGAYADGLYADNGIGGTSDRVMCYWDLGSKMSYIPASSSTATNNTLTDERYHTTPTEFFAGDTMANKLSGGFSIGGGKALRVNMGETAANGSSRTIIISSIHNLLNDSTSTDPDYTFTLDVSERDNTVPDTIARYCAPVMVAKRGFKVVNGERVDAPELDTIEIFIAMGVGNFVNASRGPTGMGIEIQKVTVPVGGWRSFNGSFSSWITSGVAGRVEHGRVAVLPYAIGCFKNDTNTLDGSHYTFGTYDERDTGTQYYLPITHILSDLDLATWTRKNPGTAPTSSDVVLCANSNIQPGLVIQSGTDTNGKDILTGRTGDCCFALAPHDAVTLDIQSTRIAMLVNDEGLNPVVLNLNQHWNQTHGLVMSGLNIPGGITKGANQVLVVRYTYAFDISPAIPDAITGFTVSAPDPSGPDSGKATQLNISFSVPERVERYLLRRNTAPYESNLIAVDTETRVALPPPLLSPTNGTIEDDGLKPNTHYYYRMCAANTTGATEWVYGDAVTAPYTETVAAPSGFSIDGVAGKKTLPVQWVWDQPAPPAVVNDVRRFFARYTLQYRKVVGTKEETVPAAILNSDEGWETFSPELTDYTDTDCIVTGLSPSTDYYLRIRSEIDSSCYTTNPYYSAWTGLAATTYALSEPDAITNLQINYSNYHRRSGEVEVSWSPQNEMRYKVMYKRNGAWIPYIDDTESNTCVIEFGSGELAAWSNIEVQVTPFNDSYPAAGNSAKAGTQTGKYRVLSQVPLYAKETRAYGVLNNTAYPIDSLSNGENLFIKNDTTPTGAAGVEPAKFELDGGMTVNGTTTVADCSHIRFVVSYYNRKNDGDSDTPMKCAGWKIPFRLFRQKLGGGDDFGAVKLSMSVYGGNSGGRTLLGTLADVYTEDYSDYYVPAQDNSITTSGAEDIDTVATSINRIIGSNSNTAYDWFEVVWDVESAVSGQSILRDAGNVINLAVYMWGFFTDEYSGQNEIAIFE